MSSEDEHHHEDADGAPAPSPLRWVEELVNTRSIELGTDDVSTPAALGRWLDDRGLATGGAVTARDHRRAIRLREGLRALMAANNEVPSPPGGATEHPEPGADPLIDLGELARTLPLVLDVHGVVPRLVPMAPSSSMPRWPCCSPRWRSPSPMALGCGSRPAASRPAAGPTSTSPATGPGHGARWRPAATGPRPGPTASGPADTTTARAPGITVEVTRLFFRESRRRCHP